MKTKTRIWILPMASAVLFAVGIVLLVVMSAGTSASIRAVGSTAYPAMDLTTRFDRRLESIVGTIQSAVAEGEKKRLDEAGAAAGEARKLLDELQTLGFDPDGTRALRGAFDAYVKSALAAAQAMLDGTGDTGSAVAGMQSTLGMLNKALEASRQRARADFDAGGDAKWRTGGGR